MEKATNRLDLIASQVGKHAKFADSAWDYFNLDDLLTPEEKSLRLRLREFMEKEVAPIINKHVEATTFPVEVLPKLRDLNIVGLFNKGYGAPGLSDVATGLVAFESYRVDTTIGSFIFLQGSLVIPSIMRCGTEEQKKKYIPRLINLEIIGAMALTEPDHGSDSLFLEGTAKKVEGGYVLNGQKIWIGNGSVADIVICFLRNTETKQIDAFIVEKGTKGFKQEKMEGKLAYRSTQNGKITLDNVFVSEEFRMPNNPGFNNGPGKVLKRGRAFIGWGASGIVAGAYDNAIKYVRSRVQFGKPIASFQLVQEKMARLLGHFQAMVLLSYRCTQLLADGRMTGGHASMIKSWTTRIGRECVAIGREVMGGNGILLENNNIKALMDMEALYTYEGTYEINILMSGREITGFNALA